jgi:8-oxo-dGTP pyrophosphatase MutT (NUDIX family)
VTRYIDLYGEWHERPEGTPAEWRIGGYAIIERDGCLLLVETVLPSAWAWDLPGGGIHLTPEETILDGISREVHEETGYRFTPAADTLVLVDDAFFRPPSGAYWRMLTFAVQGDVDGEPPDGWKPPVAEIAHVSWVPVRALRPGDLMPRQWNTLVRLGFLEKRAS